MSNVAVIEGISNSYFSGVLDPSPRAPLASAGPSNPRTQPAPERERASIAI
jgi:hypothetical protein